MSTNDALECISMLQLVPETVDFMLNEVKNTRLSVVGYDPSGREFVKS